MSTQIEIARKGLVTPQMEAVSIAENVSPEYIRAMVAEGKVVIPWNTVRQPKSVGIGKGLRTKVNASIGTSSDIVDYAAEVRKALAAQEAGADTLMELSVGGDLDRVRREVIAAVDLPVGNVPLYQAFCEAARKYGDPNKLDEEMLFDLIEQQCADGMAFMAVHCGINLCTIERLRKQGYRYGGLVSKGGVSMVAWMIANNRENPLYEKFDRVVSILKKIRHRAVARQRPAGRGDPRLLRPGPDPGTALQLRAGRDRPRHGLPDAGGGAGARAAGRDRGEHPAAEADERRRALLHARPDHHRRGPRLRPHHRRHRRGPVEPLRGRPDLLHHPGRAPGPPNEEDVRMGVKAAKIAAYIGDMNKYPEKGRERDKQMSKARRDLNWEKQFELALYPEDARAIRASRTPEDEDTCTMCGDFCASRGRR